MKARIKYEVIQRYEKEYPIAVMCRILEVSRSGYYDYLKRARGGNVTQSGRADPALPGTQPPYLRLQARASVAEAAGRISESQDDFADHAEIWASFGDSPPQKGIQMGQQVHKCQNLLDRNFNADRPNSKWVTDISYIHTQEGVLYLSMIRDLYDNSIVGYKTATKQTVNLVLDTIRLAMKKEKKRVAAELQLHSDQGFQYTSQAYYNLTQSYGITPSMSRRGNCYDNAMAENFFSILKTECIYRNKLTSFRLARSLIDSYIAFYNSERIQSKTGAPPLSLRHSC